MEFEKRKATALVAMTAPQPDKSPKGTLDFPIVSLLDAINSHPCFFTTSSCSGRISILAHPPRAQPASANGTLSVAEEEGDKYFASKSQDDSQEKNEKKENKKAGGGSWLLVSHDPVEPEAVVDLLFRSGAADSRGTGSALVFRFEPFILAVECKDATSAQSLVSTAIASGFRESGITNLHRRIMVAIRSSIRLEVPLGCIGEIMVSPEYVLHLVEIANEKMKENRKRTDAFHQAFKCESASSAVISADKNKRGNVDKVNKSILSKPQVNQIEQQENDVESCSDLQEFVSNDKSLNASLGSSSTNSGLSNEPEAVDHSDDKGETIKVMTITGEPIEKLFLWGHSACTLNENGEGQILVFGGNDTLMLDPHSGLLRSVSAQGPPSPRLGHTSSTVGKHVFVIGGRGDPLQILNDVWALDTIENKWMLMACSGSVFPGRHRHAAAVLGSHIYVFGGLSDETIYSSMYVLDSETMKWSEIEIQGERPCARHSHAMVANDAKLFMFGGYDGQKALGDFYIFNVIESCWKNLKTSGKAPSPRFSHSMFMYENYIGIIGGCPVRQYHEEVSLLHLEHCIWRYVIVDSVSRDLWVRSSTNILGDDLIIVGGGASCYAFGAKFNQPMKINLRSLLSHGKPDYESISKRNEYSNGNFKSFASFWNSLLIPNERKSQVSERAETTFDIYNVSHALGEQVLTDQQNMQFESAVLRLEKSYAKLAKDILKKFGWLDLNRKVVSSQDGLHILLPVSFAFFKNAAEVSERLDCSGGRHPLESIMLRGFPINEMSASKALHILLACGALILNDDNACSKKTHKCPQKTLRDAVCSLVNIKGLLPALMVQVPTRWECLGDMVVLPVTSFKDPAWDLIGEDLWPIVAKSLGARRLARQLSKVNDMLTINKGATPLVINCLGAGAETRVGSWVPTPSRDWRRLPGTVLGSMCCVLGLIGFSGIGFKSRDSPAAGFNSKEIKGEKVLGRVLATGTRDSTLEILVGEDGLVEHQENGITYSFDATECMFSFGNLSEKLRMARLDCQDEVVVDLFAGIGYFVLPFLKAASVLYLACKAKGGTRIVLYFLLLW
ncbi:unnamed protein product [Spirodela intermedia]|uniref:tRNA(Phe) 7-[(3-amino-3-carboxypropyl)-4-demethylwyosine(37)-N(4)]-methyltransferase n=1 Tax=Spirodela intermedia TaxID=51605 RepID=A0A7I8IK33_SPIIN|nr:unnamed protein product [Spirodela intermedia]CAA6658210.1 unnamed protein product [Spirodela intermedia]